MKELQKRYEKQIEEVVEVCHRAGELGFGAASGGNVSYRVGEQNVLITPSGVIKRHISFDDICIVDMDGNVLYAAEGRRPSGEMFMHLHCLGLRPDVKGIMHAHPPYSIGMTLTEEGRKAMLLPLLPEAMTQLGPVFTIPYVQPNGEALGYSFDEYVQNSNAFLMANHGCLVCSTSGIVDTVESVQVMEGFAKSILASRIMGDDMRILTEQEIDGLDNLLAVRGEHMPGGNPSFTCMKEIFGCGVEPGPERTRPWEK